MNKKQFLVNQKKNQKVMNPSKNRRKKKKLLRHQMSLIIEKILKQKCKQI